MENRELPLVSVVIPTYNRINTLPVSVNSVLNQTYENLELIIMDDGSTDGTEEYVNSIADSRVRYRRAEKNMGPSAARNKGAELAKGKYLAFQDSDDEWMPDKLEKQMKIILENGDVSLVYSEFGFYRGEELIIIIPSKKIPDEEKHGDIFPYLLLYPLISTQTMVMETNAFIETGGFNEYLKSYEDFEFSLRFAKNHKIGFVAEPLVKVNNSPNSVNQRLGERIRTQFYMVREMLDSLRERNLLEYKLDIVFHEAESLLCHDIYIEELQRLSEEYLSGGERETALSYLDKMEQGKENVYRKMEMLKLLPQFKQKVLEIYSELYENKGFWSKDKQDTLKQLVSSIVLFQKAFSVPKELKERYNSIEKRLAEEELTENDRLYLLADIVELFETLEKLW